VSRIQAIQRAPPRAMKAGLPSLQLPNGDSRDRPEVDLAMWFDPSSIQLRANAQFKQDGSRKIAETLELPAEYHN
jgi:hypothetical protein